MRLVPGSRPMTRIPCGIAEKNWVRLNRGMRGLWAAFDRNPKGFLWNISMSLDAATVRRIAKLARIRVEEEEVAVLAAELNGILGYVAQLDEVDVTGVEPLSGGAQMAMRLRDDVVTDGEMAEKILANAPERSGDFFTVPKVVE